MPRKKRAEKLALKVKPVPVRPPAKVAERIRAALCPICGHSIPEKRAIKSGYVTVDRIPYFDSIDWDPDKPFGMTFDASGRGSLQNWEHIGPEQAPELFEAVKQRFLDAVREWLAKGWITLEDLGGKNGRSRNGRNGL